MRDTPKGVEEFDHMKFDLHLHTTQHSSDSDMEPLAMCRRAVEIGLDGVVITEHDWLWTEAELQVLRKRYPQLIILAGIEVTCQEGHFLIYGVRNPYAFPHSMPVADLCREIHRQGGAVVAAHPFRWGQPFDEILRDEQPDLDGIEVMTNNMDAECRRRAAEIVRQRPLAGMGSSDAHREATLGVCYSEFEMPIRDMANLVAGIRGRRVKAHKRSPT
jgi:predicted metal-dependent phosphoesterase TrpH